MLRLFHQAKLRSVRTAKRYKFGFEIPRDYIDAKRIDNSMSNALNEASHFATTSNVITIRRGQQGSSVLLWSILQQHLGFVDERACCTAQHGTATRSSIFVLRMMDE